MRPAFPASDYYGGSVPPQGQQPTADLPATGLAGRRGGQPRGGSHVHHAPVDGGGAQLFPGSLATATPQTFTVASRPTNLAGRRSRPSTRWSCAAARPISTRLEPVLIACGGSITGSSRTPSRLACRARAVWQCRPVPSLSGLLPPSPAPPEAGCPQLHRPATTGQRWAFHPTRSRGASWRADSSQNTITARRRRALRQILGDWWFVPDSSMSG
jgi:hypothetical protein